MLLFMPIVSPILVTVAIAFAISKLMSGSKLRSKVATIGTLNSIRSDK